MSISVFLIFLQISLKYPSKLLEEGDYITVRGKGRFKINKILGNTRSGRLAVEVEK